MVNRSPAEGNAEPSRESRARPKSHERPSEAEYFSEHGVRLGFPDPLEGGKRTYDFNLTSARNNLQLDRLMTELVQFLVDLAGGYANGRPELLYTGVKPGDLQILSKPYGSMLTKVYRVNCVQNRNFPAPPKAGFVSHSSIYSHDKMNDLLRTRLVCKYMDGPQFVVTGLSRFCERKGLQFRSHPMHSDTGYHAWHCYIRISVDIAVEGGIEARDIWLELQVTTQLAEVIAGLTHGLYQADRVQSARSASDDWRWDPRSQQFRSAYLGHTLHLLEGIIQTFRDEVLGLDTISSKTAPEPEQAIKGESAPSVDVTASLTKAADAEEKQRK